MLDAACNLIVELGIELIPDLAFQHVSIEAQCIKDVSGTQHGMQLLHKLPALIITAQAFNQWLSDRRLRQEGETYADELGRMTEAVNRRIPQLRYAPAERAGVHRMARDVAAGRNTSDSQVYGGLM
eukprot:s8811_g2.t1